MNSPRPVSSVAALATVARTSAALVLAASVQASPAGAATTFFTDFSSWASAVGSYQTFETNAGNVALADEVSGTPGTNAQLGRTLTWDADHTTVDIDFQLSHLDPGFGLGFNLVFDDNEGGSEWTNAISIGDINYFLQRFETEDEEVTIERNELVAGIDLKASGIFPQHRKHLRVVKPRPMTLDEFEDELKLRFTVRQEHVKITVRAMKCLKPARKTTAWARRAQK